MTALPTAPSYEDILEEVKKQTNIQLSQRNATILAVEAAQKKAREYERLRVVNTHLEEQQKQLLEIEANRTALLASLLVKVETLINQNFGLIELIESTSNAQKRSCEVMAEGFRAIVQTMALDHKASSKELIEFMRTVSTTPKGGDVSITNLTSGGDVKAGQDMNIK